MIGIDGAILVDCTNKVVICDVRSNLLNIDNTVAFDNETNTFNGNFVGNFLDLEGNILFSSDRQGFGGFNTAGTEPSTFIGDMLGNIVSEDGNVLLNAITQTLTINSVWAETLYGDLAGTLVGNVIREDGGVIIDADANIITAEAVYATTIIGNLTGTFTGEILGDISNSSVTTEKIVASSILINTSSSYESWRQLSFHFVLWCYRVA